MPTLVNNFLSLFCRLTMLFPPLLKSSWSRENQTLLCCKGRDINLLPRNLCFRPGTLKERSPYQELLQEPLPAKVPGMISPISLLSYLLSMRNSALSTSVFIQCASRIVLNWKFVFDIQSPSFMAFVAYKNCFSM